MTPSYPQDSSLDFVENDALRIKIDSLLEAYFGPSTAQIKNNLALMDLGKGEILMSQGEKGYEMYILLTGALEVFIKQEEEEQYIGNIPAGECVGEMALLEDEIRSATVKARRHSRLLVLHRDKYLEACNRSAQLQLKINQIILQRLKNRNRFEKVKTSGSKFIAIYSLSMEVSARHLAESIRQYWSGHRKVQIIEPKDADKLEAPDMENNDFNLLICEGDGPTNMRFMQEADKVVYLASGESAIPEFPATISDRDELILQCNGPFPSGISAWLNLFRPHKVFRQQLNNKEHENRVIRIISESAICLVLGGGGAHGLANLGVVKALKEMGVPIDIVGGSSIGSIFAAALAMDWSYEEFHEKAMDSLSTHNPLNDYTLPFIALLKGRKMNKMLRKHFDRPMEDLWKNTFAIAANLSTSATELMETGPLDKSLAASISIPGILPPVLHKHGLLVDGGVLNNLPTDIMEKQYRGFIITVDVVSPVVRKLDHQYPISNWQFLKNKISGKSKNYIPGTMNTILKSITLGSLELASVKAKQSTIYINPRAKKGFLDWKEAQAFEKEGYDCTKRILAAMDYKKLLNLR